MTPLIRPLAGRYEGSYFDGRIPLRHPASVDIGVEGVRILLTDAEPVDWPHEEIRVRNDGSYQEPVRLERGVESLAIADASFLEALRQFAPLRAAQASSEFRLSGWPMVLLACLAIAGLAWVFSFWGLRWVADEMARFTPRSVEERLGGAVIKLYVPRSTLCAIDPQAEARLTGVVDRLAAVAGARYEFRVTYANQSVVNAFAAPAGYIVFYRGLLEKAETPEEFAGVLAHEMQHVIHKHSTRAVVRELSGRALLALMTVDSSRAPGTFEAAHALLNLQYQRSDEEQADVEGVRMLARAGVRADGLAAFLRRVHADPATWEPSPYFSSHPALLERAATVEAEARRLGGAAAPLMSAEEWAAARKVCDGSRLP